MLLLRFWVLGVLFWPLKGISSVRKNKEFQNTKEWRIREASNKGKRCQTRALATWWKQNTTVSSAAILFLHKVLWLRPAIYDPATDYDLSVYQKNPRVRKIRVRNSGAGNGCADFMDTWKKSIRSAGKSHVHQIPRFRGGGGILGLGGGSADFIFMGARIFLSLMF